MIYVVTCEETLVEGRVPFGFFNTRDAAEERIRYEQAVDIKDDNGHKLYEIYEIPDLTGKIDVAAAEYEFYFKIIVSRCMFPPYNLHTKVIPGGNALRDHLALWASCAENVIVFDITLFDDDPKEAQYIAETITNEIFEINNESSNVESSLLKEIDLNNECGEYKNTIHNYVERYKNQIGR